MSLKKNESGTVYVLKSGNRHKIGFTRNLDQRLSAFKTHCSHPVELVFSVWIEDSSFVEAAIHDEFGQYRKYREWFEFPFDNPEEIIEDFITSRFPHGQENAAIDLRRKIVSIISHCGDSATLTDVVYRQKGESYDRVKGHLGTLIELGVVEFVNHPGKPQTFRLAKEPVPIYELR